MNYLKKNWPIVLLLAFSFFLHFFFLTFPSEVVFDEVHFGKFVNRYFTRQYYFDIHPPLGKMMIAGAAGFFGYDGTAEFSKIGQAVSGTNLFSLRFLPALFGVLLVWLVYKIITALGLSKKAAFFGAFLVTFDNALLTQSKFILLDIFLLVFGFSSLYFLLLFRKSAKRKLLYLILCALFSGLAFSIKWTGLAFWGIILFFGLVGIIRQKEKCLLKLSILLFVPFLIYLSVFFVHFKIVNRSSPANAFMSPSFQKTLLDNKVKEDVKPASFWQKFIELNNLMYEHVTAYRRSDIGPKKPHPDASRWHRLPLAGKPVWYWARKGANIYLLGNFLIWWQVLIALFISPFLLIKKRVREKVSPLIYLLGLGYLANFLPFVLMGRRFFLYHYLIPLIFGILILALIYDKVLGLFNKRICFYFLLTLVFLGFLALVPLTFGFSLPSEFVRTYNNFFLGELPLLNFLF